MRWCKYCGNKIDFARSETGKFIPYDINAVHKCKPDPVYMAKQKRILAKANASKEDKMQISETEFI